MKNKFEKVWIAFLVLLVLFAIITTPVLIQKKRHHDSGFTLKDITNEEYNTITVTFSDGKGFFLNPEVVQSSEGIKVNHYPSDSIIFEFQGFDMEIHQFKVLFHNGDLFEYNGQVLIEK